MCVTHSNDKMMVSFHTRNSKGFLLKPETFAYVLSRVTSSLLLFAIDGLATRDEAQCLKLMAHNVQVEKVDDKSSLFYALGC